MSGPGRLKAPSADGAILAVPPLDDVGRLLAANQRRLAAPVDILGRSLSEIRTQACREVVALAGAYLKQAGEPIPPLPAVGLLLAGHQPELAHPGVWVKHFALQGQARRHGLTPLNLVVDHDTVKSTSLRLPARAAGRAMLKTLSFDEWTGEEPYEERPVRDEALFASFADRAAPILRDWGLESLLPEFWRDVRASRSLLGERFAHARRACERRWGCHNLEVPTSRLCQTEAFAWFAAHLLLNSARFIDVHNSALREYRRANRVRSKNHPVPDLVRDGDWCEAPFWGWRAGQRRGRLMVRRLPSGIQLRAGDQDWCVLADGARDLVASWPSLELNGRKVRFRALATTIFARLFLGDLFIHGIGGGKYDELTDVIIRRFYGMEPPDYLILSATLRLPLPTHDVSGPDRGDLIRQVRDLRYNPQRYLDAADSETAALLAARQAWIDQQGDGVDRRLRFQAIRALGERLRPRLAAEAGVARHRLTEVEAQLRDNTILRRRDFASCLYPEAKLREFLTRFLT